MGSWDQTDMLTHLPVRWNDTVRFFLLVGERDIKKKDEAAVCDTSSGSVYSYDLWTPLCLPFKAKYDTYGSVKDWDINDPLVKFHENYFQETHKISLKEAIDRIKESHRSSAEPFYHRAFGDKIEVYGFAMVIESVYQAMLKKASKAKYHDWDDENVRGYYNEKVGNFIKEVKKDAEEIGEKINRKFPISTFALHSFSSDISAVFYNMPTSVDVGEALINEAETQDKKLFEETVNFCCFGRMMDILRTPFMPQCGQGSQTTNYELHKARAEIIINHCEKAIKRKED